MRRLLQNGARHVLVLLCLVPVLWAAMLPIDRAPEQSPRPPPPPPVRPFTWPNFDAMFSQGVPLIHEGCNTISYGSAPDLGNRLIGRVMNGDPITRGEPSACPGGAGAPSPYDENESLTLVELNPWPSAAEELAAPIVLSAGSCRRATSLTLCYGWDGNLTLAAQGRTVWSTAAYRFLDGPASPVARACPGCVARFQTDGNLVLYQPDPASNALQAYWASGTGGHPGARLELSPDSPYVAIASPQHALIFPHYLSYQYKVLDTSQPVRIEEGRQQIVSAYDATLAAYEGEYWVAFECALASGVTSSCVGPLVETQGRLSVDVARTSVVATGRCARTLPVCVAASVPKILNYHGTLYLFWDDLQIDNRGQPRNDWSLSRQADVQQYFISVNARAARLGRMPGSGRVYVEGRTSAIVENDVSASTEVMRDIDLAQVIVAGDHVLATGSLTQGPAPFDQTCAMPLNHVTNCYRLAFAEADSPLGPFRLLSSESRGLAAIDGSDGLPNRPALYNRFVYLPDGQTALMGGAYFDISSPAPQLAYTLVSEDYFWPDGLLVPVCDPVTHPYPEWMAYSSSCIAQHPPIK